MSVGGGAYWTALGMNSEGGIDELLESDEFTLEEILLHEDVIQECKFVNSNLIEYLSQEATMKRLVNYIVNMPEDLHALPPLVNANLPVEDENVPDNENEDGESGVPPQPEGPKEAELIKIPYVVSEIFACETMAIISCLVENEDLMTRLFSLLDHPVLTDERCAYFRKVVAVLLRHRYDDVKKFIVKFPDTLSKVIKHISIFACVEVIIMLGMSNSPEEDNWLYELGLVPQLIDRLNPDNDVCDLDVYANASNCLVDLVVKCGPNQNSVLVSHLGSDPMLRKLFGFMTQKDSKSLDACLLIVLAVLRREASRPRGEDDDLDWGLPPIIELLVQHFQLFVDLLIAPPNPQKISTQNGVLEPALGHVRLKAVELCCLLTRCQYAEANKLIVKHDVPKLCLNLMLQYPNHNVMHTLVEIMMRSILDTELGDDDSDDDSKTEDDSKAELEEGKGESDKDNVDMKTALFTKWDLPGIVMQVFKKNEERMKADVRNGRLGYMGHFLWLANAVDGVMLDYPILKKSIDHAQWVKFFEEYIEPENRRGTILLGGVAPPIKMGEDDMGDFTSNAGAYAEDNSGFGSATLDDNQENAMTQEEYYAMFNKYQMQSSFQEGEDGDEYAYHSSDDDEDNEDDPSTYADEWAGLGAPDNSAWDTNDAGDIQDDDPSNSWAQNLVLQSQTLGNEEGEMPSEPQAENPSESNDTVLGQSSDDFDVTEEGKSVEAAVAEADAAFDADFEANFDDFPSA